MREHTVAQTRKAMHGGHLDDEGEQVVDESVESLVGEDAPRQMRHRLELVVDEQLRRHHDESERVHGTREARQNPRVPSLVRLLERASE